MGTALLSLNAVEHGTFPVPPLWVSFTAVWPSDWVYRLGTEGLGSNLALTFVGSISLGIFSHFVLQFSPVEYGNNNNNSLLWGKVEKEKGREILRKEEGVSMS